EFVEPLGGRVALLIDLRGKEDGTEGPERAIATAARVGLEALERGTDVEVHTTSGDREMIRASAAGTGALLRSLALLPVGDPSDRANERTGRRTRMQAELTKLAAGGSSGPVLLISGDRDASNAIPESLRNRVSTFEVC
ncbi:MAG TPA: hypothetical protein VEJ87_12065, partial [Acidimicrobiales bacterium]|nr:hypothetical protein [Acidimicrobiales bacterium]